MANFFGRLFGMKGRDAAPVRDVAALVDGLGAPAVHVVAQGVASRSHFGGPPQLPDDIAWPERNGRKLAFLARVSLAEVQAAHSIDWLPGNGALLFFYDVDEQPWGFDPQDRGGWAVVLVPDLVDSGVQSGGVSAAVEESPIPHTYMGFRRIDSLPSSEHDLVAPLDLTDEEFDSYYEVVDSPYEDKPKHQIAGFPAPVQNDDMELECQLVSHGLYCGDGSGYNDPRASSLGAGAESWRLLFQFDTDDDLGVMWGDCGAIYFWVEANAARGGDFSNAWLILQCS